MNVGFNREKYLFINDWMIGIYGSAKLLNFCSAIHGAAIKVITRKKRFDVKNINLSSIAKKNLSLACSEDENR